MFRKKISSDLFLLILLVVRLRLDSDNDTRWNREPESREVQLGNSFAYTQINFHLPQSNVRLAHPKSLDFNEFDEAAIIFNRLNYFNSVRERSRLLAYYASSPGSQDIGPPPNAAGSNGTRLDSSLDPSLPTGSSAPLEMPTTLSPGATSSLLPQDLTREDMDLIEILWKQDIDLGVTRDAYDFDSRQAVEAERLKESEYSKQHIKVCFNDDDIKVEEESTLPDELAGLNYTVDSETGEYILDELTTFGDTEDLPQTETREALREDSYLPVNENAQSLNLTDVFSPSAFDQLLPENFSTDSEFFLSQIEDLEKELAQFESLNGTSGANFSMPGDVFPNLDDCLSDSTSMLPILALSGAYQENVTSLSQRTGQEYNLVTDNNVPHASTILNRPSESFSNILHTTSLDVAHTDDAFSAIPSVMGPSSIGCAVVESMATLTNDTDPLPNSNPVSTGYHAELPEIIYANQSAMSQQEMPFSDLLLDDYYMLTGLPAVQDITSQENIESSSDSISLASGDNPSGSDCADMIDSCSESSSHYGDRDELNRNNSHITNMSDEQQTFELFHSAMPPKRLRPVHIRNEREQRKMSQSNIPSQNQPYFTYKNSFSELPENPSGMMSGSNGASSKQFGMAIPKPSGASCGDYFLHNHSYHLPFVNDDSIYKPFVRDKSKSSSDEDYCSKDDKKAKELKLPISIEDIINLAIDEYNERLSKYELTEEQLTLIRDIRRRGKNKVAAQNCRKRKMDQISTLQQDLDALHREYLQLKSRQNHLLHQKHHMEDKYTKFYQLVLQSSNTKPPGPSNNIPLHSNNEMTFSMTSDIFMSDDDTDLSRGARTKRKMKK